MTNSLKLSDLCPTCQLCQDLLIYGPIYLLFYHTILPIFVRYKIKDELDSAADDPIMFKAQMPTGQLQGQNGAWA